MGFSRRLTMPASLAISSNGRASSVLVAAAFSRLLGRNILCPKVLAARARSTLPALASSALQLAWLMGASALTAVEQQPAALVGRLARQGRRRQALLARAAQHQQC